MSKTPQYECCCACDSHTGRAGRSDDSLYIDTGKGEIGPLCETCHAALRRDDLQDELSAALKRAEEAESEVVRIQALHIGLMAEADRKVEEAERTVEREKRELIGWLSGDIPELHDVLVPRLAESLDRFNAVTNEAMRKP